MCNHQISRTYRIILCFGIFIFLLPGCSENDLGSAGKNSPIIIADFEKYIDFNNDNSLWKKWSWQSDEAKYEWIKGEGHNGSNCISLASGATDNDVALTQEILLEGDQVYQLSAWIKTDHVIGGRGANICLFDTWESSEPLTGSNYWQKVAFVFLTPESGKVIIACRLGFYGETATGKAWFDDVQLQKVDMLDQQSQHFRLRLKKEDALVISSATITNWLENLDKAYGKYYELIGQYPYHGKIITIFSVDTYPGGWAVAGNPILWHQPYVRPTLLDIENKGDWSFGILHEIGHDFAPNIGIEGNDNWNFDEEMLANFRMYYVVESLNASVIQDKVYTGSDLKNFYKKAYDSGGDDPGDAYDRITYTLIRIRDKIGWEPFKKTFQYLYKTNTNLTTNWQRFSLFLDKISEFSGEDVRQTFPEGDLDRIKEAFDLDNKSE